MVAALLAAGSISYPAAPSGAVSVSGPGCSLGQFKATASAAWKKKKWRDGSPVKPRQRAVLRRADCLSGAQHKQLRRYTRKVKAAFHLYREYREVAPYRGPGGTWWAIPYSIVSCESHGSWSAYNPSGAVGPYQLLGWGAPFPVHGFRDKLAHHRIAASVYAGGSGRSNWVC